MNDQNDGKVQEDADSDDESSSSRSSEDEEEYNHDDEDDEYQTDDDEEESRLVQKKTLLFLCQEGQIRLARRRLQMLQEENRLDILRKEIFQKGDDQNYPLHEVIMGGTLEESSKSIIPEILQIGKQWKGAFLVMLNAQPPSHGRTALHWAAWGNASFEIIRSLTMANPEALVLRGNKKSGCRTPLETFKRYFGSTPVNEPFKKLTFLESSTLLWSHHRLRLAVYKAALHWFRLKDVVPFDKRGRKETGITPKNWFCLSILGYCLQREMEPLLWRILGFVGNRARFAKATSRKRRRS